MRRVMTVLVMLAGCADAPIGESSAALWDGGRCDVPEARLYELRFLPVDSGCGEVRTRVRRLDGPSDTGWCVMQATGGEGCAVHLVEQCETLDGDGLTIVGDVLLDDGEWRGVADVTLLGSDGEATCSGRYDVRTRAVYGGGVTE